jgi:bacillopeptidase F (M6 metalloprotease family)
LRLLSKDPYSGEYAFWGNRGDESDTTLQRPFDFTQVSGPIEMTYHTWYDIEDGYDFVYVEASTDGQQWQVLKTPSGTASDPSGNSFGWAYTGSSEDWREEKVDLSQFAGQNVSLRFEYITDDGATAEGFLLDDISIPAIGYSTDFESDDGGWQAAGFARIKNSLPQTFRLALITKGDGTKVQIIPLTADQTADIPLDIGEFGVDEATLIVSGTTRFTTQQATYSVDIQ